MLHLIIIIIVLAFFNVETRSKTIVSPTFTKHVTYPGNDFIFNYSIGDNVTFTYALCEQQESRPKKRKCILTLEILASDGMEYKKSCPMYLSLRRKHKESDRKYALAQFGNDKIIFAWKQGEIKKQRKNNKQNQSTIVPMTYFKEFLKVRVIHMTTCQFHGTNITTYERNIPVEDKLHIESLNIVSCNNRKFELFFRNEHFCGKQRRCKMVYNLDDRKFSVFSGSTPSLRIDDNSSADVFPIVSSNLSTKAYIVITNDHDDGSVKLLDTNGQVLLNHEYSWSIFEIPTRISHLAISSLQETFGMCQQGMFEPILDCSLFDYKGNATLGVSLDLKSPDVQIVKMHNLPDGSFIVLIGYNKDKTKNGILEGLDILQINSLGEIEDLYELKTVKCPLNNSNINVNLFERKGYRYCYYVACSWANFEIENRDKYHLEFHSECIYHDFDSEEKF